MKDFFKKKNIFDNDKNEISEIIQFFFDNLRIIKDNKTLIESETKRFKDELNKKLQEIKKPGFIPQCRDILSKFINELKEKKLPKNYIFDSSNLYKTRLIKKIEQIKFKLIIFFWNLYKLCNKLKVF